MQAVHVEIQVEEPFRGLVSETTLRRVAEATLARERLSGPGHASVTITDDETLRALNRDHRGEDAVTDVLSFGTSARARNGDVSNDDFPIASGEQPTLGDVIISFPQARRQAESARHPVERELALLAAHGMLHLLGFDHARVEEEKVMFAKQEAVVDAVLGGSSPKRNDVTRRRSEARR